MKQIEYTDEQKKFLEILAVVNEVFKPNTRASDYEKHQYYNKVQALKEKYGIKEKYKTLREYINEHSKGAYHRFFFQIGNKYIDVISVEDFEIVYKGDLLDKFYVVDDNEKEYGNKCENYECDHILDILPKED